jgi:hypothetical protein
VADLVAVEPRKVDVEDDGGRALIGGGLDRRGTVAERHHAVARLFEEVPNEVAKVRVVVDHENRVGADHRPTRLDAPPSAPT